MLVNSCKNYIQSQSKNNLYQNIVETYIEYRNLDKELDKKENILILGANKSENTENAYWIDIAFVNPKLLSDFKYSKVYEINGYKLILDESLDKSNELKNLFDEVKYENFNLATESIDYNLRNWHITFNSKNEIIRISPLQKSKNIKDLLVKKGVKFSSEYHDIE